MIHDAPRDAPIVLHVRLVRLDAGGYDVNGTYFGTGDPLYWYADEAGTVDAVGRAKRREDAIESIRTIYPRATFTDDKRNAGEEAAGLDEFVTAYATCALWSSTDNSDEQGGEPLDRHHDVDDIAPETMASMVADCKAFRELAGDLLAGLDESQCGHDFWLTRNGHGTGFWDRGLGAVGAALTKHCKSFGGVDLYVGDDDKIH